MSTLCNTCDREILEIGSEYNSYVATLRRKNDNCLYTKNTFNNFNLDELDKISSDYISHYNKKFDLYFINCEFELEFDNTFTANIETNYRDNMYITNLKSYLLYYIEDFKSRAYKVCNIKQMNIKTINCMCNMKYEYYINQPMHSVERRINIFIAKNTQLINALDRNKNHPLINKYSRIPFINN